MYKTCIPEKETHETATTVSKERKELTLCQRKGL